MYYHRLKVFPSPTRVTRTLMSGTSIGHSLRQCESVSHAARKRPTAGFHPIASPHCHLFGTPFGFAVHYICAVLLFWLRLKLEIDSVVLLGIIEHVLPFDDVIEKIDVHLPLLHPYREDFFVSSFSHLIRD